MLLQGLMSLKNFKVQLAFVNFSCQLLVHLSQLDQEFFLGFFETLSAVTFGLSDFEWLAEGKHEKLPDLLLRPSALILFKKGNLGVDVLCDALNSLSCFRQTSHKVSDFTELFDVLNVFVIQDSQAILHLHLNLFACLCYAFLNSCEQYGFEILNLSYELSLEALTVQHDRAKTKWLFKQELLDMRLRLGEPQ
jgi:hypothetical protein